MPFYVIAWNYQKFKPVTSPSASVPINSKTTWRFKDQKEPIINMKIILMRASCFNESRNTLRSKISFCFFKYTYLDKLTWKNSFVFLQEQLYWNDLAQSISIEKLEAMHFISILYPVKLIKKGKQVYLSLPEKSVDSDICKKMFSINEVITAMNMKIHISLNEQIQYIESS